MALPEANPGTATLERYLKGEPLTPDLEALQAGEDSMFAFEEPNGARSKDAITDDDREHLRRMKFEPGWPVLLKLVDREIEKQDDFAQELSMDNPLGNRDKVAEQWAYVAMLRRARNVMVNLLEEEVRRLAER
jgi:hypothetical protein